MSIRSYRQALTPATLMWLFALLVLIALGGVLGALPAAAQTPTPSKTSFTYQGQLLNAGSRLNATCSFQFTLYDAATEGNIIGATQTVDNVAVQDSYFAAQLDFGVTPFGDAVRYLALAVKCPPEETFTAMEGRMALTAAPAALVAQKALAAPWNGITEIPANLASFSSLACTSGQVAKWNSTKTTWECAADNDTTYDLYTKTNLQTTGEAQVHWGNLTNIPANLTDLGSLTCTDGQIAKWNAPSKAWECKADNDTTYDVYTKSDLQTMGQAQVHWGNLTNVPVNLANFSNLACTNGQIAKWNGTAWACGDITVGTDTLSSLACTNGQVAKWNGNAWACAADNDTTYDLYTKTNLQTMGQAQVHWGNLTNIPSNLTFLNSPTACANGQVAKWNGTAWACAADSDTTYTAGTGLTLASGAFGVSFAGTGTAGTAARSDHDHDTSYWKLTGNASTTPGTNFIGTTDSQALEFKVNNLRALRLEPNATSPNVIGGYSGNTVTSGVVGATIGGGGASSYMNTVTDDYGTVGGGYKNRAGDNGGTTSDKVYATVGGGSNNIASNNYATVSGGSSNSVSGQYATTCGGSGNSVSGQYATICGGYGNIAGGQYAMVGGGSRNRADASYSYAAGSNAIVGSSHAGAFVWADSDTDMFNSAAANEFAVRATGGVRFITSVSSGVPTAGVTLSAGGGSWNSVSDRDAKANFVPVDTQEVLKKVGSLPLSTWNYKTQAVNIRHMGPMAQDLYQAFGLGEDAKHVNTVDADGVALAAIQGLYQQNQAQQAEIAALKARLAALEDQLKQK